MKKKSKGVKLLHIGKQCPKGFRELPGGIHLGDGMWALNCELIVEDKPKSDGRKP